MTILQNVSRETLSNLRDYEALIKKWSISVNLIANSTLPEIWERHIVDSAKIYAHVPTGPESILDIGSGGGLPGLVLAIIAKEKSSDTRFTLIESDQRKAAFLSTVTIQLGLNAVVVTDRIEAAPPAQANVVTARALAPLPKLLGFVDRHLAKDGIALLSKGRNHANEVALAREIWDFDVDIITDEREQGSVILKIYNLKEKPRHGS